MKVFPFNIKISALDKFSGSFANLSRKIQRIGTQARSMGLAFSAGITAPVLLGTRTAFDQILQFETAMNALSARTLASEGDLKRLRDVAIGLGKKTRFSLAEAATAMEELGAVGLRTNEILEVTPAVLDLAAATNLELGESAKLATDVMKQFGLQTTDMVRIADVLAGTTANSSANIIDFGETMKFAGPIAKTYGLTLEETSAAIGVLGNIGIRGSLAGTALKNIMLKLADPSKQATAFLKHFNIQISNADGSMRNLVEIFQDVGPALNSLPKAKQLQMLNELFGLRAVAAAGGLTDPELLDGLSKMGDVLMNIEGTARRMAGRQMGGLPGAVKELEAQFSALMVTLGDAALTDAFTDFATSMKDFGKTLSEVNPDFIKMGLAFVGVLAVAGPLLGMVGLLAMMFGNLGAVVAGVAVVSAGLFASLAVRVGGIKNAFILLGTTLLDFMPALRLFAGIVEKIWSIFAKPPPTLTAIATGGLTRKVAEDMIAGKETEAGARARATIAEMQSRFEIERKALAGDKASIEVLFKNPPTGMRTNISSPTNANVSVEQGIAMEGAY